MLREEFLEHSEVFDEPLYLDDELYHFGILGMRHGKRNGPPYPLGKDAHSASEKKHKWWESLHAHHKAKKKKKQQKQALEKARKVRAKNKKDSDYRNELVEKGTKESIIENRYGKKTKKGQRLTDEEVSKALDRIEKEDLLNKRLNAIGPTPALTKFTNYADKANQLAQGTQKFINAYNTGAAIYNAIQMANQSGRRLPKVNTNPASQDRNYDDWKMNDRWAQMQKDEEEKKKKNS